MGHDGSIVLVGEESHLPYDRPPLSKEMLEIDTATATPDVQLRPRSFVEDELGVVVRTQTRATGLDTVARTLYTDAGEIRYGELVIATGAAARKLPEAERYKGIHALRTLDDSHAARDAIAGTERVVVIGAGFIGSEVASGARKAGREVTIVESAPSPLVRSLGCEVGELLARLHRENGSDLRVNTTVTALHPSPGSRPDRDGRSQLAAVDLSDGSTIETSAIVAGIGAAPSTDWLENSGVQLDSADRGVVCDSTLAVTGIDGCSIPHLWAAGDVAHWPNPKFARVMRLEHWTNAAEQGSVAVKNALGTADERVEYSAVPYFWSDLYGTRIQFVGIPQADSVVVQYREEPRGGIVALYRGGDQLVGTLTIGRPDLIMKYRRLITKGATWAEGVKFGADKSWPG